MFHERLNPQLEHYYSAIIYTAINNFALFLHLDSKVRRNIRRYSCRHLLAFFFLTRTDRRPFNSKRKSIVRLCTASLLFFFHLSALPRDVIVITFCFCLKRPSINVHSITGKEGRARAHSSSLLIFFALAGERLNRKNETDEWRRIATWRGENGALLSSTEINGEGCVRTRNATLVPFAVVPTWCPSPCVRVANQSNYPQTLSRVTFRAGRISRRDRRVGQPRWSSTAYLDTYRWYMGATRGRYYAGPL